MSPVIQILLWSISFLVITYSTIIFFRKRHFPPNNDDDGGTPIDAGLPFYDPPGSRGLDDLLIDRPPKDWIKNSRKPINH